MLKILFVEDDPDQIVMYQTKFELEGLLLLAARDGKEAMEMARRDKPNLILMDLLLRHENGVEIMEKLKVDSTTRDIPVIVFTNFDKKEYRQRAEELGALDYIVKAQVTPKEIVEKVKEVLKSTKTANNS